MQIDCSPKVGSRYFIDGLKEALKTIDQIESSSGGICLSFSPSSFVTPLYMGVLLIKLLSADREVSLATPSYLSTVYFDQYGLRVDSSDDMTRCFQRFESKTYLPIINFLTDRECSDVVASSVATFLKRKAGISGEVSTAVSYLIAETVDNIWQHACTERGYICCQAYPNLGYIDVCIFDCGISLVGSFKKSECLNQIKDDVEAMAAIINHQVSTKNLPDAENRGFGIRTSRRMIVDGLKSEYLIYSGRACFLANPNGEAIRRLPDMLRLCGTLVAMRVPIKSEGFIASKYYAY